MVFNKIQIKEQGQYWYQTAAHDYETMKALVKVKRFADSLFFGHIILEKIIKAYVVSTIKEHAPKIHDLARLADIAKIKLTDEEIKLLNKVNEFNLRCRYPDAKLNFYKLATKDYSQKYIKDISKLYLQLCQNLKQKK
ncbi:MAG: HEPN domain-containing protein [bacterium]